MRNSNNKTQKNTNTKKPNMKKSEFYCLKEIKGKLKCKKQCKNCKNKNITQKDKKTLL